MKLFKGLTDTAPNKVFFSIVLGALAGICYSLLIPIVLRSIAPPNPELSYEQAAPVTFLSFEVSNEKLALLFISACLFILIARSFSQISLLRVSMDMMAALRIKIYRRIVNAPTADIERLGSARLLTTLTRDVDRIVMGARILPDIIVNIITLIGMLGFLLYLNNDIFWFVMGAMLFGLITYQIPVYFGRKFLRRTRQRMDNLQESIRGLIYGVKELKLNRKKKNSYFDDVLEADEYAVINSDKKGQTILRAAANYGDLISFFSIGAIIFIFVNYHAITSQELVGVVMAMLYITTPIAIIINSIPMLAIANISLHKVEKLMTEIPAEELIEASVNNPEWSCLSFRNVSFQHVGSNFALRDISFDINKGEIAFIVGGNGTGKSTLAKLITHHYRANSGEIFYDRNLVTEANIDTYRQSTAAIFSDYFLFDRLLGDSIGSSDATITYYLNKLGLDKKVTVQDSKFSTLALSDGQRKRLALLVAFLENKGLYVFDEWAADQDPQFKEIFYRKILPELSAKGKAVVAISHDDRYFDVADKLLVMEEGKLIDIKVQKEDKKIRVISD